MRKYFALFVALFLPILSYALVPLAYVSDTADILTTEQEVLLNEKIQNYERGTTNEIGVLTIQSLNGDTIENIAQKTFTEWGIGKADKNNGVLVLVAVEDRQMRIHTGYGVEGDLPDIATYYIQEEVMKPAFREGDFYGGIDGAVDRIVQALGGESIVPENYSGQQSGGINFEFLAFALFIVFDIAFSLLARSKSWWGGGVIGGIVGGAIIWYFGLALVAGIFAFAIPVIVGLIIDYFVSKSYSNAIASGTHPWWMRGGGGGGMSGGGFGGFGGGMSGGGGSSSRW